jgi:hypothetical protein
MSEATDSAPLREGNPGRFGFSRLWLIGLRADPSPRQPVSLKRRILILLVKILVVIVGLWLLAAYVILPALWRHFEHQPVMVDAPKTSLTAQGITGDPLNVAFIGTEESLIHAMLASGWKPADPITLRSSARIASSVLLNKPYADAPVSNLFVFGRKQDLAFERAEGKSARHRHHVRFWRAPELGREGVPLWIGAVTFDQSVGLSHLTGQITHHIGPDIDAERDGLIGDLRKSGWLTQIFQVTGVGSTLIGRNGGGDLSKNLSPEKLSNPPAVQVKEQLWTAIRPLLRSLSGP